VACLEVLCLYSAGETEGIREKLEPWCYVFWFRALPQFPILQDGMKKGGSPSQIEIYEAIIQSVCNLYD
jgi:hypothetical protein